MKKRILVFAATLLLCASLAGCGEERVFIKDENDSQPSVSSGETTVPAETTTQPQGVFTFTRGIQMGMTVGEMQKAVGQVPEMSTVSDPVRKSCSVDFSGVFIRYLTTKSVIFLFDPNQNTLIQLQFRCDSNADGATSAEAIKLFDERYGKQAAYQGRYPNHVWFSENVYMVLSEINADQYVITYTEKAWFEEYYQEEARAYRRAQ